MEFLANFFIIKPCSEKMEKVEHFSTLVLLMGFKGSGIHRLSFTLFAPLFFHCFDAR
jgi:hypothetical protein